MVEKNMFRIQFLLKKYKYIFLGNIKHVFVFLITECINIRTYFKSWTDW